MSRARAAAALLPDDLGKLMGKGRPVRDPGAPERAAQDLLNLGYLKEKLGVDINKLRNTQGIMTDNALMDAAIIGGGALGLGGITGLAGADGGQAIGMGALGAGVAAAPAIFNEVRDPKFRSPRMNGRKLVGLVAAGAGAGTGTSLILDALGVGGGRPESNNLMIRYA